MDGRRSNASCHSAISRGSYCCYTKIYMQNLRVLWQRHKLIVILCTGFFCTVAWMASRWYSHQLNPDALSYFSIASKYAHGDLKHAINGYWSPLLSWLLVPAVWLHMNLVVATKLINALVAIALIVITYTYLLRRSVSRSIIYPTCIILADLLAEWVVYQVSTPDLLEALGLVVFALCLSRFMRKPSRNLGYLLGAVGAFMYFAKGFGFYLFIGTVVLAAIWEWWNDRKHNVKIVIKRYAPVAIVFATLVLPFVAVISIKYHQPTINNAGTFDWNVYGIHGQGTQPIDNYGPLAPPNPTAISAWEDPTFLASKRADWSPFESRAAATYFFKKLWWPNFNAIFSIFRGFGAYVSFAFIILIIGCFRRGIYQDDSLIFTTILVVAIAAYSLIFIDARYLWGEAVLALIATAMFLSNLYKRKLFTQLQIIVAAVIICGIMVLGTIQALIGSRHLGKDEYDVATSLQVFLPAGSHIMSDQFAKTFPICYQLHLRCYNVLSPPTTNTEAYTRQLQHFGVAYFLDFHSRDNDPALQSYLLAHAVYIHTATVDGLSYSLYSLDI